MSPKDELAQLLREAEACLRVRAFQEAHALCLRALRIDVGAAQAYFLTGQIAAEHGNWDKAVELVRRAIGFDPAPACFHAHLARALIALKREGEALDAVEQAIACDPQEALTLDTIGVALSHAGYHERAIPWFERAVALEPENARFLHNLGVSQQFSGDFVGAENSFRAELAVAPAGRRPYAALVHLSRQTRDQNYIPELERQFAAAGGDLNARLQLGHALSKTYDDLGEYDTSFDWLARAKEAKARAVGDISAHARALFETAVEAHTAAPPSDGDPNREPIFIIGMPRTGTTLVDRIIASHPDVMSAGELGHVSRLAAEMAMAHAAAPLSDVSLMRATARIDARRFGQSYIAATRPRAGASPRFIDKMPVNFLYAGLIHRALPNARILCLRRHPLDVVVSNFRQIFNADAAHYWYSYGLESTARYYVAFDHLIAQWRALLPAERFMEVRYEAVVDDLESEARRILSFCGLEWNPACLAFHENTSAVATASSVQVRSPIYASSLGRWKRYGERMAPARRIMEAAGIAL